MYRMLIMFVAVSVVILNQAGVENFVISVSCILDVFMEPAVCHGSATVSDSGVDYSVMQVMTCPDLWFV